MHFNSVTVDKSKIPDGAYFSCNLFNKGICPYARLKERNPEETRYAFGFAVNKTPNGDYNIAHGCEYKNDCITAKIQAISDARANEAKLGEQAIQESQEELRSKQQKLKNLVDDYNREFGN